MDKEYERKHGIWSNIKYNSSICGP